MSKKRIDCMLVEKHFVTTRSKAVQLLKSGNVYVNKKMITKAGSLIEDDANIEVKENNILDYVSRGGLKLQKALNQFAIQLKGKIILDIGASTGGFTDCCLKHQAKHVYALDVGNNQLVESIKNDVRVTSYENTNFKDVDLSYFDKAIDIITIDVSFISIRTILLKIRQLFDNIIIIGLFKPQFEVGKQNLNKDGVVKNKKTHEEALIEFVSFLKQIGYELNQITYSPIVGAKSGNVEYLCLITQHKTATPLSLKKVIQEAFLTLKEE